MSGKNSKTKQDATTSTIARSDDGTIQITFTLPYELIEKSRLKVAEELGRDIDIPGFRKGKAPVEKIISQVHQNTLLEKTLSEILPQLVADIVKQHKIKPAIYPKFELLKAQDGEDWQIRAVTCELPEVKLGDYKEKIAGLGRAKSIWTPYQGEEKRDKKPARGEKEQEIIKTLLETVEVTVPKILIDEEANSRLSQLLSRIEKLGLTLESYLASIKKTAASLRAEYEEHAKKGIALDIILNEIAATENIKVDDAQIEAAIAAGSADPKLAENLKTPEQKRVIASILRRRAALDLVVSLL